MLPIPPDFIANIIYLNYSGLSNNYAICGSYAAIAYLTNGFDIILANC